MYLWRILVRYRLFGGQCWRNEALSMQRAVGAHLASAVDADIPEPKVFSINTILAAFIVVAIQSPKYSCPS